MSANDWLIPWDDGLTQRLTHCTRCGARPVVTWGICGVGELAVAYVTCQGCRAHLRHIEAWLEARYGTRDDCTHGGDH